MIPAGRRAISAAGVAEALGITLGTLRNTKPYTEPGFPPQLNPDTRTGRLWDAEQVRAHVAGEPVSPLPTGPDHADLLDDAEAAAYVGIAASTWMSAVQRGARFLTGATPVDVHGVRHWRRDALDDAKAAHRTGRPRGAVDTQPRKRRTPAE